MYEFRYGPWLKAFAFIFLPGLIALFVWALFQYNENNALVYFICIVPASVGMIALGVYGILDAARGKFVITRDSVTSHSPVGTRSLMHDEIRGFRQDENYIRIIPIRKDQKEIKISTYLKDSYHITSWLQNNYDALDILEGDEEERQVLDNDAFGIMEEQRIEKLAQARKVVKVINAGAWVCCLWLFVFPEYYYHYAVLLCCLYPIIALFTTLAYRGLISPDEYEKSKMPSLSISFIMPGLILLLRMLFDFDILEHPQLVWAAVVSGSFVLTFFYLLPSFRFRSKPVRFYVSGLVIALLNMSYSYGVIIATNCILDQSPAHDYETIVINKRTSSGETTTYYLDLQPWGTLQEQQEAKVSRAEYESIEKGDQVTIRQHVGYLTIPWIELSY